MKKKIIEGVSGAISIGLWPTRDAIDMMVSDGRGGTISFHGGHYYRMRQVFLDAIISGMCKHFDERATLEIEKTSNRYALKAYDTMFPKHTEVQVIFTPGQLRLAIDAMAECDKVIADTITKRGVEQ